MSSGDQSSQGLDSNHTLVAPHQQLTVSRSSAMPREAETQSITSTTSSAPKPTTPDPSQPHLALLSAGLTTKSSNPRNAP